MEKIILLLKIIMLKQIILIINVLVIGNFTTKMCWNITITIKNDF